MSRAPSHGPNPAVRSLSDRLGDLLALGDDAFVERGPALLQAAIRDPAFFDGVATDPAPADSYTRRKVVGDPGGHVVRFMEWPPGYSLLPHEHHGRPCFEVLVDGLLVVVDMAARAVGDDEYELRVLDSQVLHPGDAAVVDPRINEIHAVYSPVRSRSLHVYPDDAAFAVGYCLGDDDRYTRTRFELDRDSSQP